jgi:hypothetical protein
MSAGDGRPQAGTVYFPPAEPGRPEAARVPAAEMRDLPRRRRPARVAGALVVVVLCILGVTTYVSRANHQVPVIMIDATVPGGTVISASDLTTVDVAAGPGVQLIPARQLSQVTGEVARTTMGKGHLLTPSDLASVLPPGPGQLLVPVPVRVVPASGLAPGDHVLAIATPAALGQSGSTAPSAPLITKPVPGVVYAVTFGANEDGNVIVDLIVAAVDGPPLEEQAYTGQIALLVASRSL